MHPRVLTDLSMQTPLFRTKNMNEPFPNLNHFSNEGVFFFHANPTGFRLHSKKNDREIKDDNHSTHNYLVEC